MLSFEQLTQIALFFACCLWIRRVAQSFRKDLSELRSAQEPSGKLAIFAIWLLAIFALVYAFDFVATVVARLG